MFKGRTLKNSPASKKAPPAVSVTGEARSQAWHNCTKKALPIFPSQTLKSTSTKRNIFWRVSAYPDLKKKKSCAQPLPSSNSNKPETRRLTCIMGWEPLLCTGSLSQSLPPQRHHRVRLRSHPGLPEKKTKHNNRPWTTSVKFGSTLCRTMVSQPPSHKVK